MVDNIIKKYTDQDILDAEISVFNNMINRVHLIKYIGKDNKEQIENVLYDFQTFGDYKDFFLKHPNLDKFEKVEH